MATAKEPIERVLLVAPRLEPRGTSEYTLNLARELKNCGVQVLVMGVEGPMLNAFRRQDIEVQTFNRLESWIFHLVERGDFIRSLRDFEPQVIHLQSTRVGGLLGVIRKHFDVPVLLTVHSQPQSRIRFRRMSKRVDCIIASSQVVRAAIVNRGDVPKDKISVIPNGIPVFEASRTEADPIFSRSSVVVGSIGPVEKERGHELFIEAASRLIKKGSHRQFLVAGEGSELPDLRRLVRQRGLQEYITFVGGFSEYEDILDAVDVAVQSSLVDVSGFSILEAMGHGRPVVAFNTGTACEIIDDQKTGRLVPKGDVNALANAIEDITSDKDKAQEMGAQARQRVMEKFNIQIIARDTLDLYGRLAAQ